MLFRIIVLTAMMIWMGTDSIASEIQFMTHSLKWEVYTDEKGEIRGKEHGGRRAFNVELVREMMILLKHPVHFMEVPFKRGFNLSQSKRNYAFFNVNRTPEREETVKWVGPLQSSITYFYELKNAMTGIQNFEDAKRVNSICVLNGNVHHKLLEKKGFTNIAPNSSYSACIKMLIRGRVNLTPLSNISSIIKDPEFSKVVQRTPVKLSDSKGYLVFNISTPDSVIQQWQETLDQIRQSGRYKQLVQQYLIVK